MSGKTEGGERVATGPTYERGDGKILVMGWAEADEYGAFGFRATIEFPAGPPEIPFNVVWRGTPILVLIKDQTTPQTEDRTEAVG